MRTETLTFVENVVDESKLSSRLNMTLNQPIVLNDCSVALTRVMISPNESTKYDPSSLKMLILVDDSVQLEIDLSVEPYLASHRPPTSINELISTLNDAIDKIDSGKWPSLRIKRATASTADETIQRLENQKRVQAFETEVEKERLKVENQQRVEEFEVEVEKERLKQVAIISTPPTTPVVLSTVSPPIEHVLMPNYDDEKTPIDITNRNRDYIRFSKTDNGVVSVTVNPAINMIKFSHSLQRLLGFEHASLTAGIFRATFAPSTTLGSDNVFCHTEIIENQIVNGQSRKLLGVLPLLTFDSVVDFIVPTPQYLRVVAQTRLSDIYIELRSIFGIPIALPIGWHLKIIVNFTNTQFFGV